MYFGSGRLAAILAIFVVGAALDCSGAHTGGAGRHGVDNGGGRSQGREDRELVLVIDPPGALRGCRYEGVVSCGQTESEKGKPHADFTAADSVRARPRNPSSLSDVKLSVLDGSRLAFGCFVSSSANPTECIEVAIEDPASTARGVVCLNVVNEDWDPLWRPRAVAPADTTVAGDTSLVILDATGSYHPAGLEAMTFRWTYVLGDREYVLKGEPITSVTLPRGRHAIVLCAQDRFGNRSLDTMLVVVK